LLPVWESREELKGDTVWSTRGETGTRKAECRKGSARVKLTRKVRCRRLSARKEFPTRVRAGEPTPKIFCGQVLC
jgi:hypothetical protein